MMKKHSRPRQANKKRVKLLVIMLCILLVIALALLTIFVIIPALGSKNGGSGWFDPSAQAGNLPSKTEKEIQAELDKIVEEGMFNISIANTIAFADGQSEGQARIENIAANPYHMSVKITLDDTGETVYESGGLAPGSYIEYIRLAKDIDPGTYSATALFTAHNKDDLKKAGQAAAKITLVVEN